MSLRTTRIASAASLLLAAALTLSACSTAAPAEQEKASAANTVTITDNHGEVEVPVNPARVVALDMSRVPDLEYSALQSLVEGERRIRERGVTFWLCGLNPSVLEAVRSSGLGETLGRERMLFNARTAIERYQALVAAGGEIQSHRPSVG